MKPKSILVLGASGSAKSSFLGQLVLRTERASGSRLQASRALSSYAAVSPVLEDLSRGIAPRHTEAGTYAESTLTLEDSERGEEIKIVWPEFAGEQVERLARDRLIPPEWAARVRGSDVWILFIRLSQAALPEDALSRRISPQPVAEEPSTEEAQESVLTEQARMIELLQLLTFVRGLGSARRIRTPTLAVVLSCYDEVPHSGDPAPMDVLSKRLPLFADYVRSMWAKDALVVLGLAAVGRALDPTEPDVEFITTGPEANGFLVLPDGHITSDLTLAVSLPLDMADGR